MEVTGWEGKCSWKQWVVCGFKWTVLARFFTSVVMAGAAFLMFAVGFAVIVYVVKFWIAWG